MSLAYETDFNFWIVEQTKLLKERRFDELDIEHLIEEMEDMRCVIKSALESHISGLILHMIKVKYNKNMTFNSWHVSITAERLCIKNIIKKNPSLEMHPLDVLEESYKDCRIIAIKESGLNENVFPVECPWTLGEILGE